MPEEHIESDSDKQPPENGDRSANQDPKTPDRSLAVDPPQTEPPRNGLNQTTGRQNPKELPFPTNWPPRWALLVELILGFGLLASAIAQVIVGKWQWDATNNQYVAMMEQNCAINSQLTEMKSQTVQAKATAKAASDSVAEAKRANDTAADAAKAAKDSVAEAQRANATAEKAADAAIESNTIANGAAEKQLRAYVTLTSACALQYTPRKFRASLTVKNAGQTPAYKVMSKSTAIFKPKTYSGKFDLSQETYTNGKEMTSGPGREWTINVDYNLQKTDEPGFNAHTSVIWVFGQIVYVDAFGNERFTNFRFKQGEVISVSTKQQGRGTVTDGFGCALLFTDEGNDSN